MKNNTANLKICFFLLAFLIGLLHLWYFKGVVDADGISYIDIGYNFFHGDRASIVRGSWSPLYPLIIGFFIFLFKVTPYWESTVVHLANFFIYLFAFFCFSFFLEQLIKYNKQKEEGSFPEWFWFSTGYTLFIWTSVNMVTFLSVTPDMLVTAIVYLASGILLKIKLGSSNWSTFILFGFVLGIGYLTKAAMLPMAFVYLGLSVFAIPDLKKRVPYVLLAFFVFILVASPLIILLSKSKGHATYSETVMLNYAWHTDKETCLILEKGFPGCGKLNHPPNIIYNDPFAIEYSKPFINATYPILYDPSYWYEGGTILRFNLKGQIEALVESAKSCLILFSKMQVILLVCMLLFLINPRRSKCLSDIKKEWIVLSPALVGITMYFLISVEFRYIASYIVIFWLGLFSALRLSVFKDMKNLISFLAMLVVVFMITGSIFSDELINSHLTPLNKRTDWIVASELKNAGVKEGDKIAVVGHNFELYWARLAKVSIIAEVPDEEVYNFWGAESTVKSEIIRIFKNAGAKAIVTSIMPHYAFKDGWNNIKDTPYYFYII